MDQKILQMEKFSDHADQHDHPGMDHIDVHGDGAYPFTWHPVDPQGTKVGKQTIHTGNEAQIHTVMALHMTLPE